MSALSSDEISQLILDDPLKLYVLGKRLLEQFQITGSDEDICHAITVLEEAADRLLDDDPMKGRFVRDLAQAYRTRYQRFGRADDLQMSVSLTRSIVALIVSEEDPNFPIYLSDQGMALMLRFDHTGDVDDISEAIRILQRAVQITPVSNANLPHFLDCLGTSMLQRFERIGHLSDISEAIRTHQRAVQLTPVEHVNLPVHLYNLGLAFMRRFEHTGNLDDISETIQIQQRAVELTPDGDSKLPAYLDVLASSISHRFERKGDLNDVVEAIRIQQRVVQLAPDGHPDLFLWLNNLGASFMRRFERTGSLDDISEAIRIQQLALEHTPEGHRNLSAILDNLGSSFLHRFNRNGDSADLSEAIRIKQRAIEVLPDGHAALPIHLNNLGATLMTRFDCTGDLVDISEAIQTQQRAIQFTPDGHLNLPAWHSNLGNSFSSRFKCKGDLDDLSEAIQNQQRAIQLTPDGDASLASFLQNLGSSLMWRFEHSGDLVDISEAIRIQQRAIELTPDGHAGLSGRLHNLGSAFVYRFERVGDRDDISDAIRNQQRAIELTPDGDVNLPCRLNSFGFSYMRLFGYTGDLDDIFEAIRLQQRAVRLTPDGHTDLPRYLNNLGVSYLNRFKQTEDLDDISEAIRITRLAVQHTPEGDSNLPTYLDNLGFSLTIRFRHKKDLDEISEAIQLQKRAIQHTPDGHVRLSLLLNNLGISFVSHFQASDDSESLSTAVLNFRQSATSISGPPSRRLAAARNWATFSEMLRSPPSEQLEAHACIINLLSIISGMENTIQNRHKSLLDTSQLSIDAAAAALSFGESEKALEWLAQGRCIVWNQINQLRSPLDELRLYDPDLAERFSILSRELENAGLRTDSQGQKTELSMVERFSLENEAGLHIKHAKDWETLLNTIRNIHGFEDFLRPRKCADIMCQLPEEGPIVIINIHRDRCDALALLDGLAEPIHIPLPEFSYQEAERLAGGLRNLLLSFGVRVGIPLDDDPLTSESVVDIPKVLGALWSSVVTPILGALGFFGSGLPKKLSRIWWCPTGPLAFLPIHAAGNYEKGKPVPKQCLSDFAVSSYIPTVEVFNSVKKSSDKRSGMLMVSQPSTPGMGSIPFAKDEVEKIQKQLDMRGIPFSTLNDEKATVKGLLESMAQFSCIHLACHASQNMTHPLKSSIYMHDGPLELSEIIKKNLENSNFAFLSACQTSKGDPKLPEEVVHLASGMLAAGYRSVVGTMWSIIDEHGPDLAKNFYETLLDNAETSNGEIDGSGAARALHAASGRLRDMVSDLPMSFLIWVVYAMAVDVKRNVNELPAVSRPL